MDNLISRHYVIECVYKALRTPPPEGAFTDTMSLAIGMVNDLPPARSERKKGKWVRDEFGSKCSCCGLYAYRDKFEKPWESNFCPNCGADMREEGKDE